MAAHLCLSQLTSEDCEKIPSGALMSFSDSGIIGDVVDDFKRVVNIGVAYGTLEVHDGDEVPPGEATSPPHVRLNGTHQGALYTLLMVDPDAPSPDDPKMRGCRLHWVVTNIPGGADDISGGDQVLVYAGPTPPRGKHRYALLLFDQGGGNPLDVHAPEQRGQFSTRTFARNHDLTPVGGFMYYSEKEH